MAGGANGDGTVFEIVKTATGYAGAPTTLVSFNGTNGAFPVSGLIADANGDLFGTTNVGGANNDGTVFEIVKTAGGYASTPTTLVSFDGTNGEFPEASLIADANGDLFGTTTGLDPTTNAQSGGTVFEIAKTAGGYASTPTILVSFNGTNGETPFDSLIADSNGDLFGTTDGGGANGDGTAFEITAPPTRHRRHPVAEHGRAGLDLGDGREQLGRRRAREPQSRAELEGDRKGRFLWRRRLRHPVAEHEHRPSLDLGNGWEQLVGGGPVNPNPGPTGARRDGRFQWRRPFRHPVAEHQHRPSLDLGDRTTATTAPGNPAGGRA